jgi:hypothetical protein
VANAVAVAVAVDAGPLANALPTAAGPCALVAWDDAAGTLQTGAITCR